MHKKAKKIFGECYEPELTHKYNYMFDTTTINKLVERPQDIEILFEAGKRLGYEYFRCRIQDDEICGLKSDGTCHKRYTGQELKIRKMHEVIDRLSIQKVPCLAKFVERGIALSDINYLKDSSGKFYDVFSKVFDEKVDNLEDAIIVEAGMRYNCVVVSNDRRMCENTRKVFPDKAIWYHKFIEETKNNLNSRKGKKTSEKSF